MWYRRKNMLALVIFAAFGAIYALLTNIFFEKITTTLWTPLAIALYFFVFAVLLCILIIIITKKLGHNYFKKLIFRDVVIVLAVVFVASMLFEFLYELGSSTKLVEPTSYILMIDDSGSMESSDPEVQRKKAIKNLLEDKESTFKYSIYVFADSVTQVRDMKPKSYGYSDIDLKTGGGTAMFECLETVLNDINTGKLSANQETRVVLLSDGCASDNPVFKSRLLKGYVEKGIIISTIGLGYGVDTYTMKQIAEYTGGVYIHIDDASQLDQAMQEASIQTANRNLLGYRGYCTTPVLHAILRVVFLLVIIALIYILKIYSYGKYYKPNMIISGILCVLAGILPEITLQEFFWNDNFVRIIFCVLIAITLVEPVVKNTRSYHPVESIEFEENSELPSSSTLDKLEGDKDSHTNSLG